ncbi:hypothetical protein [Shimazuella soli]|uniref:hypothetical protein n=1 Tax=Shimazuella soli TaxID=1892854 RepID=UPI001F109044|nr:hypothetical protein [Shimazuella soli]
MSSGYISNKELEFEDIDGTPIHIHIEQGRILYDPMRFLSHGDCANAKSLVFAVEIECGTKNGISINGTVLSFIPSGYFLLPN